MAKIKVLVRGALGKVGREIANAVSRDPELELVGGVDIKTLRSDSSATLPVSENLETALEEFRPDVLVDFTNRDAVMEAVHLAVKRGIHLVIGTSGISKDELAEIDQLTRQYKVEALVAPNFSLGAVIMMHLARIAAKFFDYAEITELHHEGKLDSPSGTAVATAEGMVKARGKEFNYVESKKEPLFGARGALSGGIPIHSVRLPGLMAHQEVIFGATGQTLKIRHDQISREGFSPGVIMAIKEVMRLKQEGGEGGLIFGLDQLMDL